MKQNKQLILPVILGEKMIAQDIDKERISSADVDIKIMLNKNILQNMQEQTYSRINISSIKYQQNIISLYCSQNSENSIAAIYANSNKCLQAEEKYIVQPFSIALVKNIDNPHSYFHLIKKIIDFVLIPVLNAKFVKNQRLDMILDAKQDDWGLLSMDQSQRIITVNQTTSFPIIGFWINNNNSINHPKNIQKLIHHVHTKYNNKCKFTYNNKRYFFYLMRINYDKKIPQLYLIETIINQDQQILINIPKNNIFNQQYIILSSVQTSSLQFTLRSDQKIPQKLININCSPIKFVNQSVNFLQISQKYATTQDSPRFKTNQVNLSNYQNSSLRDLVKKQQIQINQLKREVLMLNTQLKRYKKQNKSTNNNSMTSYKTIANIEQQSKRSHFSLSKSTQNIDLMNQNAQNLSTQKSNKIDSYGSNDIDGQQAVWQKYELIQK